MNTTQVIAQLQAQYPGKAIFKNNEPNPTEIICEIEPSSDHPDYSVAIAVIDQSIPHYHQHTEETYEVIRGELTLHLDDQTFMLYPGGTYNIKPGIHHWAEGQEVWIKTTARPGWTPKDHILI
jgi:mannose-6-phosphate isomerase-like protein (cupin superfamily)